MAESQRWSGRRAGGDPWDPVWVASRGVRGTRGGTRAGGVQEAPSPSPSHPLRGLMASALHRAHGAAGAGTYAADPARSACGSAGSAGTSAAPALCPAARISRGGTARGSTTAGSTPLGQNCGTQSKGLRGAAPLWLRRRDCSKPAAPQENRGGGGEAP